MLREAEAEITQYRTLIYVSRPTMRGSIHIGDIAFNEELDELMREELVKSGIKLDNTSNIIAIIKSSRTLDGTALEIRFRENVRRNPKTGLRKKPETYQRLIRIDIENQDSR